MAGVFGLIKGSQRRLVGRHGAIQRVDPRALELQAAKEILAETFGIRVSEVEEMIHSRFDGIIVGAGGAEDDLWPQEFWLEG
jgi:hypothetical protein